MYNEEENIAEAVRRALSILPRYTDRFEVILVNDGSKDKTGEIADSLAGGDDRIRAVHHPKNLGYGVALRSGLQACRYEWIFYTDGDNQFDLDEIRLLLPLRASYDIVTGYRMTRSDPWNRKLNAWIFNSFVRFLFDLHLRDVDCAFKLYRAEFVTGMELRSSGALIDVEILRRARKRGARIGEIGVHHYPRTAGSQTGAKLSVIMRAMREMLLLWWTLR
jgi:glycosyltransferase involved in cell wall biosynthesis